MTVQILGNAAGGPYHGRGYTAQLLQLEQHHFLIDCGEGTQQQVFRFGVKSSKISHIFISHLHGDHVYGLPGLLTSFCLQRRKEPLSFFAPSGLKELITTIFRLTGVAAPFELRFFEVDTTRPALVFENSRVAVYSLPLEHRTPCTGWLFREKPRPRNILKSAIEAYGLSYAQIRSIKAGGDLLLPGGDRVPNEALTLLPRPPVSYAYCSDTAYAPRLAEWVQGVDLLYHEATFTEAHATEADISRHSTAAQAARVALAAGAGRLLLGHFSGRYPDASDHLLEARAIFPNTEGAAEGERYTI